MTASRQRPEPWEDARNAPADLFANVAAECALLGYLMQHPAALSHVSIRPDDFTNSANRTVFETLARMAAANEPVDAVTLVDRLQREKASVPVHHVLILWEEAGVAAEPLAEIVRERTRRRRADSVAVQFRRRVWDYTVNVADAAGEVAAWIADIATPTGPGDGVIFVPASSIEPRNVEFAWAGRIPLGMLSLVVGIPEQGKSMLSIELAARLTRGQLDGNLFGMPTTAAIATAEDAWREVVRPRLEAAGADLDRVHFIAVRRDGITGGLQIPDDLMRLKARITAEHVRYVVIDPLVAHLPVGLDGHRDQHVRTALAPMAQMAEETGAAVVGIMHLNKTQEQEVLHRVGGSIAFVAAPRSVLLLGRDQQDPDGPTRILAHAKCNIGPKAPSLRLRIEGREIPHDVKPIVTSGVAWCGEAPEITARDLVGPEPPKEADAVGRAKTFLLEVLGQGPVESKKVSRLLKTAGIPERAWKKAKADLGIKSEKLGFKDRWEWSLPEGGQAADSSNFDDPPGLGAQSSRENAEDGRASEEGREREGDSASDFAGNGTHNLGIEMDPLRTPCLACGASRFWRSIYNRVVCAECHPPADPGLIRSLVEVRHPASRDPR